jgi:hypothetical protein
LVVASVLATGCEWSASPEQPPKALAVEYLGNELCSVAGSRFIGAERGCTVELDVSVDPDIVADPSDYQLEVTPPYGPDLPPVRMDGGRTLVSVPITGPSTAWRGHSDLVLRLRKDGDAHAETLSFDMTLVDPATATIPAWLWTSYWALADQRLGAGAEPSCSGDLAVVTLIGGDLASIGSVVVDVYDLDPGAVGMHLDTVELSANGTHRYEARPAHLCDADSDGGTFDNVDPTFDTELRDPAGLTLDELAGYELDLE